MKAGKHQSENSSSNGKPELIRRSLHKKSTIISGRTISEKREKPETANERAEARKKDKMKSTFRVIITIVGFIALGAILVVLYLNFTSNVSIEPEVGVEVDDSLNPTLEITDATGAGGKIPTRTYEFIGKVEHELKELGLKPLKAVLPNGTVREVDFYLEGYSGFIKMTIDRDPAVSAEDTDRMIRYLTEQGITDYEYIDVRIDGRAFWK